MIKNLSFLVPKKGVGMRLKVIVSAFAIIVVITSLMVKYAETNVLVITGSIQFVGALMILLAIFMAPNFFRIHFRRQRDDKEAQPIKLPVIYTLGIGLIIMGGFVGGIDWMFPNLFNSF